MAVITDIDTTIVSPNLALVKAVVQTRNTVDAADTIAVTLGDIGIDDKGLLTVLGWKHTTDNSVIEAENPTTSVTSGVLTITVPAGTSDDLRVYEITGRSTPNKLT